MSEGCNQKYLVKINLEARISYREDHQQNIRFKRKIGLLKKIKDQVLTKFRIKIDHRDKEGLIR